MENVSKSALLLAGFVDVIDQNTNKKKIEIRLTSLNSATCFWENIENTLDPTRLARRDDEPPERAEARVEPEGDFGVAEAAGVAAGVSSGVASTVEPPSSFTFFTFLTFFSFSD